MNSVKWRFVRFEPPLIGSKILVVNLNEVRPTVKVTVMDTDQKNEVFTHWIYLDDLALPEWPDAFKGNNINSTEKIIADIYSEIMNIKQQISERKD